MPYTLQLATETWDLQLDSAGRIVTVSGPYAVAQNVANAVRLFTKDAYFNQQDGVPHFQLELGKMPSPAALRDRINRAALAVDGVATAQTTLTRLEARKLEGFIEITTTTGETVNVAL